MDGQVIIISAPSGTGKSMWLAELVGNRQSRQRLDRHGTIVVGSCETFHHYNVQGVK